jgi:DNA-binding transcriptional ArsR family regulator
MAYDNNTVFKALSDPSRRSIVERLSSRPMTVRQITDGMSISQPAVSQHLDRLRRAGLVRVEGRGASNVYSIDPKGLGVVRAWLDRYWSQALDNYARLFEPKGE